MTTKMTGITGIASLRHESPPLALVLYFIPPKARNYFADIILLWLECRRGLYASEAMPSAIRLAWWRDALRGVGKTGAGGDADVPLVMRLQSHHGRGVLVLAEIADVIAGMIERRLAGESPQVIIQDWHACMGGYATLYEFQPGVNKHDRQHATAALAALDKAMLGAPVSQTDTSHKNNTNNLVQLRLIHWLAANPARLNYPHQQPWLPLHMAWGLCWGRI